MQVRPRRFWWVDRADAGRGRLLQWKAFERSVVRRGCPTAGAFGASLSKDIR